MTSYDLVGIGNAILDVLAFTEDDFVVKQGLPKGGMMLIDEAKASALYGALGPATETSGGSAANTLAGFASLGGKAAFIGKVKNDTFGDIFRHDLNATGVHFSTPSATGGPATGRCYVCVTPDAERTMATYLGACAEVTEAEVDAKLIESSAITYIEGYLWDPPAAKTAIRKALDAARAAKRKVAFTLSDLFCVERHRAEFKELMASHIDILFANEAELCALTQTADFDAALAAARGACPLMVITRSEKGCVVVTPEETLPVPTVPVAKLVDTTGAGDLFAAGFLYGHSRGWDHAASARLGNACAGHIITQLGARPKQSLKSLAA